MAWRPTCLPRLQAVRQLLRAWLHDRSPVAVPTGPHTASPQLPLPPLLLPLLTLQAPDLPQAWPAHPSLFSAPAAAQAQPACLALKSWAKKCGRWSGEA